MIINICTKKPPVRLGKMGGKRMLLKKNPKEINSPKIYKSENLCSNKFFSCVFFFSRKVNNFTQNHNFQKRRGVC